ncbi:MAG: Crp/Fnr family transcriptional regulator [Comamonadaceae bacterium]|nr:Crp/Fnr family transcriptional regulator [Comamonadaceae bacterium]
MKAIPVETPMTAGRSSLADLLGLLGCNLKEQHGAREAATGLAVGLRRVSAGQHLVHMGAPSVALYFVRTGTFKISRSDEDGYEQVLAFAGRGEMLGYDALCANEHPTNAVALEDSTVFVVSRSDLAAFGRQVPLFDRELHRAASHALARNNDLVDVMAAVSSEVRLARFLLQLSRQMAANGQSPRRFILRMGRRDLASLLGVAHETVSRSFTTLSMARLLHVQDRDVEILDLEALQTYSRCTRKPPEDAAASGPSRHGLSRNGARATHGLHLLQA